MMLFLYNSLVVCMVCASTFYFSSSISSCVRIGRVDIVPVIPYLLEIVG